MLWIFVLASIAFLDRVNISIAGPAIAKSYRLSDIQLGTIFSPLLWGYAISQTLCGRFADRLGPRRVLAGGVVWSGIFRALTAMVPAGVRNALIWFAVVRFALGQVKR